MKIQGNDLGIQLRDVDAGGIKANNAARTVQDGPGLRDVWGGISVRLMASFAARFPESAATLRAVVGEFERAGEAIYDSAAIDDSEMMARGRSLHPGAGTGCLALTLEQAADLRASGEPYVFVTSGITKSNVDLALSASAIVFLGGRKDGASAAAARLGKPAIALRPSEISTLERSSLRTVTVDATHGLIGEGELAIVPGHVPAELKHGVETLRAVYGGVFTAEASTKASIERAVSLGADRIRADGDLFLQEPETLRLLRGYVLSTEAEPRRRLLEQILVRVRAQAEEVIQAADGKSVTFAFGSRSPHTFFPVRSELLENVATEIGLPAAVVKQRVESLGAGNSKLGLRGSRWAVKDLDLFSTLARATFEAQAAVTESAGGSQGSLRLLVPAVTTGGEIALIKRRFDAERTAVEVDFDVALAVEVGAAIETAAAALNAGEIAAHASFVEYSVADMTESMFGVSRDDAGTFLPEMQRQGIIPEDPFVEPAVDLVGKMVCVGQYIAGDAPNCFPAALRGPLSPRKNTILIAEQAGVREIVAPAAEILRARLDHAMVKEACDHATGLELHPTDHDPDRVGPSGRKTKSTGGRLFDVLATHDIEAELKTTRKLPSLPEGVTPLEYVEGIIAKVEAGALTSGQALLELPADIVDWLGRPVVDPRAKVEVLATGLAASSGSGQGRVAFSKDKAEEYQSAKIPYVLIVNELHAQEVPAVRGNKKQKIPSAQALISVRGGVTSHAAMIAQNSDVPCVMNDKVQIDLENGTARIGRTRVREGDFITVDGTKGRIIAGGPEQVKLVNPSASSAFHTMMKWADEHRRMDVVANADTPEEAVAAFEKGASAIGLVRTEHMFYGDERINAFRAVILGGKEESKEELGLLEGMQFADFRALLASAKGRKVQVRLLDPPLYEFLPQDEEGTMALSTMLGISPEQVLERVNHIQEVDSLMGLRGARLAMERPDIEAMQVRALARAYVDTLRSGVEVAPLHITIPMVNTGEEMQAASARVRAAVKEVAEAEGVEIPVKMGAMIETPTSALESGSIAEHSDYFSFGTNDLTQMTLGFGRNVAGKFVPELIKAKALKSDPTASLDANTVGKMMYVAILLADDQSGRIKSGICGGQGSDPDSARVCEAVGVSYLSVPPGQVPKARLAAAQAALARREALAKIDVEGPRPEMQRALTLGRKIERALLGVPSIPAPLSSQIPIEQLDVLTKSLKAELRVLRRSGDARVIRDAVGAFEAYARAKTALDLNEMSGAMFAELGELRAEAERHGLAASVSKHVEIATAAITVFNEAATARIGSGESSTRAERDVASHAWTALRSFEAIRSALGDTVLPTSHRLANRLWHHNDGWDNNHYTRKAPQKEEPMGVYLKRVASEFLKDNGLETALVGGEKIPTDRPVIYAITHRSGAIDRFTTMNALPIDDDKFMYIVREKSPLDLRAKESYGADNPWIVPVGGKGGLDDAIARVQKGFERGAQSLITYPAGTGSIMGEPRFPATGTVLMAIRTDAVLMPVTNHDDFSVRPFREGAVTLRVHDAIDPLKVKADLGTNDEGEVARVMHAMLEFDLGADYRALLG